MINLIREIIVPCMRGTELQYAHEVHVMSRYVMSHVQNHGPAVVILHIEDKNLISRLGKPALNLVDAKRKDVMRYSALNF